MQSIGLSIAVGPTVGDDILKIIYHKVVSDSMIGNYFGCIKINLSFFREKLKLSWLTRQGINQKGIYYEEFD